MPDAATVLERTDLIRNMNQQAHAERARIRAIMNGGVDGIAAVMAWDMGKGSSGRMSPSVIAEKYGTDLPTVNLMASGVDRLAQRVGVPPSLKAPFADDEKVRAKWENRTEVVRGWDWAQRLELHFPQVGRWLPGYNQVMWQHTQRNGPDGKAMPWAKLKDSYDVYPGWLGADQQPEEIVVVRVVPFMSLKHAFPELDWDAAAKHLASTRNGYPHTRDSVVDSRTLSWEGPQSGIEVCEYHCADGVYLHAPELRLSLQHSPNPLESGPAFTYAKRVSFDAPISQYHHVVGLMTMMAKMNVLGLIAAEDSVFRETNIAGELESGKYRRGRFAVNLFSPGTQVSKPTGDQANQLWAQLDRLERQFRIGAAYDVTQDGRSPVSYATGEAVRELGTAAGENIREYQMVLRHAVEDLDRKRLEWADKMWRSQKCTIYDMNRDGATYIPKKDIAGDYRTRRVYGAMAGWDDQAKAVVGLQYLQAGVFDIETIQENVSDLENGEVINNRNRQRQAEAALMQRLASREPGDPMTDMALIEIMDDPSKHMEILKKYMTPQEPQVTPLEEEYMAASQGVPAQDAQPLTPEAVTSVMSRLEAEEAGGGIQTVGTLP